MAQVAVCSEINTKHINTVWAHCLGVRISPKPDQEGNELQRPNSKLLQATQKQFRRLSVQPGLRGSSDLRVERKMVTFQLFFQSGRAKDLSAPQYFLNFKPVGASRNQ